MKIVQILVLLVVIGGVVWHYADGRSLFGQLPIMNQDAVASVNGETLSRNEFDTYMAQASAQSLGQEIDEEEQKQQVLDRMIREELVLQDAKSRGITASDEEVANEYAAIVDSFESEDEFQTALTEGNMTDEQLRGNIARNVIFEKYVDEIEAEQNIQVSEAEISAFYDEIAAGQEEVPALEEVQEQIKQQLMQQKLGEAIESLIQSLREQAEIKILI